MEVLPTHTCFDDAVEFLENLARRGEPFTHFRVVHAVLKIPKPEVFIGTADLGVYAHAWLRNPTNNTVVFAGIYDNEKIYIEADRDEYYAKIEIVDSTEYDTFEVARLNEIHGTFGPWKEEYIKHCRQGEE